MTSVGSGTVAIFPTFRGFRSEVVSNVDAAGTEGGSRFASAFGSVVKGIGVGVAAATGAAIAGIAGIASKGFDRALNIQDAKAKLTGLGHDAQSVQTIMDSALASVKGTSFGLGDAAGIAASAVAAGIAPGEALTRTLTATANAAAIAGTPLAEMGGIINKVATSGKLSTDVLNQFQERGIPLLQSVAKQYGVTADEAAAMVTRGEVDFASFQTALEQSVGTGAAAAGQTARGAFDNIGAAFGRLGAMFVQPAVDGAPTLFNSISGAVDRATTALAPFAAELGERLTPAIAALSAWIDTVDFSRIATGIHDFYLNAIDVKDLLTTGFTENETLLPPSVVTGLQVAHDVIGAVASGIRQLFEAFQGGGDLSGVGTQFSSIGDSVRTLQPALASFVTSLPKIGGAAATLAAAGLDIVVQALSFLADNVDTIIAFMPAIVAGFLLWKGASAAVFAQSTALAQLQLRMLPLTTANTFARLAAARAELQLAAATGTSNAAQNGGFFATARATAAMVAQKVAMVASKGAMIVATAAQWAWNAALTANPIGIIIVAIAALVAGLIWFFTQTELGQEIWANFTSFLSDAWNNLLLGAQIIFTELGNFFSDTWTNITSFFQTAIAFLVDLFLNWTPLGIVISNFGAIVTFLQEMWANIVSFFGTAIGFLVDLFLNWTPLGIIIKNFGGIVDFFVGLWTNITGAVSTGISNVIGFFTGLPGQILSALSGLGTLLVDSGKSLIQGFIDGIGDMVTNVTGAVDDILGKVRDFFPFSPAKRGPFSGKGWTRNSGQSIVDGLAQGMEDRTSKLEGAAAAMARAASSVTGIEGIGVGSSSTGGTAASRAARAGSPVTVNVPVQQTETDPVVWGRAVGRELGDQLSMMGIGVPA